MIQFLKPLLFFLPTFFILSSAILFPFLPVALFSCHENHNAKLKHKFPFVKAVYSFRVMTEKIHST